MKTVGRTEADHAASVALSPQRGAREQLWGWRRSPLPLGEGI